MKGRVDTHLVDKGQVYSAQELHLWGFVWVLVPTGDLQGVDAVLVDGLRGRGKSFVWQKRGV